MEQLPADAYPLKLVDATELSEETGAGGLCAVPGIG
jgi:hypothetical protein